MEAAYRKEADCMIVPMPREVDHHVAGNMTMKQFRAAYGVKKTID